LDWSRDIAITAQAYTHRQLRTHEKTYII
jgi:hypothetical protein